MKIRLIALLAVAALTVMAVPASADIAEVAVFTGTASVGTSGGNTPPCSNPTGQGLQLPTINDKSGFWRLNTSLTGVVHGAGSMDVCGKLGPVDVVGVGASCGMSKGSDGNGSASAVGRPPVHPGFSVTLSNVGWITSAGGTIPALGNHNGGGAGQVVALVQAQGGQACLDNVNGAQSFVVAGVAALV